MTVNDHPDKAAKRTRSKIEWLLSLEQVPTTLNTHYFSDYKDKVLAYYKAWRNDSDLVLKLRRAEATTSTTAGSMYLQPRGQDPYQTVVNKVLSGLSAIGISVKATELPKLLPPAPMEPALNIMESVQAYFQGGFSVR